MCGKLVSLTNIPTPYRIHFFTALSAELAKNDWQFEAFIMAQTEPGRFWNFDRSSWQFPYCLGRGPSISPRGTPVHLKPNLVVKILATRPHGILMSGSWFHPTNQLVLWLAKALPKTKIFFWTESNLDWVRFRANVVGLWRSATYRAFDGFVLPGKMANEYLEYYAGPVERPRIYLPNLVDETIYSEEVTRLRVENSLLRKDLNLPQDKRLLFSVCRLTPVKGIMELLKAYRSMPDAERDGFVMLLAGDGEQRSDIEAFVAENQLSDVRLLGHLDASEIAKYYAVSDGFILPSLGDPYPLAVIEAAFAGLPLLLSKHVGCHPEALEEERNGWLFDPRDESGLAKVLCQFVSIHEAQVLEMGRHSACLAAERFSAARIIPKFAADLVACMS